MKRTLINDTSITERLPYPCRYDSNGQPVVRYSALFASCDGDLGKLGLSAETLSRSPILKNSTLNAGLTGTVNYATTSNVMRLASVEGKIYTSLLSSFAALTL